MNNNNKKIILYIIFTLLSNLHKNQYVDIYIYVCMYILNYNTKIKSELGEYYIINQTIKAHKNIIVFNIGICNIIMYDFFFISIIYL